MIIFLSELIVNMILIVSIVVNKAIIFIIIITIKLLLCKRAKQSLI